MSRSAIVRLVRLLWVVPLSLCSFAFHRAMLALFRALAARVLRREAAQGNRWKVLTPALLARRGALPLIMLDGPRWNTHAIIGQAGPLEVKGVLSIDAGAAARSARSWSIVIYRFPRSITIASIGSTGPALAEPWQNIPLPPGSYALGVRYYHPGDPIELPAVRVDGVEQVPPVTVAAPLSVYDTVRDRRGLFYRFIHHYIFHVLEYRDWLPAKFVRREFLPVGNPQTHFRYGAVRKGQSISLRLSPALLSAYDVFFTLYNRCSFPVDWYAVSTEQHDTRRVAADGFYLVRIHCRSTESRPFDDSWAGATVTWR